MKWSKYIDNIITAMSLPLMASGAVLNFYQNGYRLLSEIIIIVGLSY